MLSNDYYGCNRTIDNENYYINMGWRKILKIIEIISENPDRSMNPQFTDIKRELRQIRQSQDNGIIIDVVEKVMGDETYLGTFVIISFDEPIDGKRTLTVPIDEIYGRFEITPEEIREITYVEGEEVIQGGGAKKVPSWAPGGEKRKNTKPIDELKELVSDFLEKHVLYLSKIIYDTDYSNQKSSITLPHWSVIPSLSRNYFCH